MHRLTAFIICLFIFVNISNAQEEILLLNGKIKKSHKVLVTDSLVYYKVFKGEKEKTKYVNRDNVFSVNHADGKYVIIYAQDTLNDLPLTVEEMQFFIKGEQYADSAFKSPFSTAGGVITGAGGAALGFYGLIVPAVYTLINGAIKPKVKNKYPMSEELASSPDFRNGYRDKARKKKTKNSIIGGLGGFAGSAVILYFITR